MIDILDLKRRLTDRVQSVAEYLLPNGRKDGQEWRAGSVSGEKGQSLGVHLTGVKAGVWADFSTGEGGDLIDLWSKCRGLTIAEAVKDVANWLGVSTYEPVRDPKPSYDRPPKPKCSKPEAKAREYLAGRGISDDVLEAYRIGERGEEIIFPFLLPDGVLAMAKARKAVDGAKPVPTSSNCEAILFGWQAISDNARTLIITEGEIDALSWACFGYPAVSVPFGGGKGAKQKWIENEFDRLARFERILLSLDMDAPGDEAAEEISARLGRHRCFRVSLPHKDANSCLTAGVSNAEMQSFLDTASSLDPAGLRRPTDLTDKVIYLFWPGESEHIGYGLPYDKLAGKVHFRPAELTLWSGASGHGKSQILSDCIPHWIKQGSRVCVASLEMKGEQTLKRMAKQTGGVDRPTAGFIGRIMRWLDQGLLLYDHVGKAGIPSLLEVFDYARAKYGCDQFVIDSLMRLGIPQDDYNGQEKAVFQLIEWTVANNVHLHLVAHSRKGDKDRGAPETEDIKGAMEIGANAFNIVTVWRNKAHEDKLKAAKSDDERADLAEIPGVIVNIAKQRNGDFEGKVGLWFDQATYRYHTTANRHYWDRTFVPRGEEEFEAMQ